MNLTFGILKHTTIILLEFVKIFDLLLINHTIEKFLLLYNRPIIDLLQNLFEIFLFYNLIIIQSDYFFLLTPFKTIKCQ